MFDLSALQEAKNLTQGREQRRQQQAEELYREGIELIERFALTREVIWLHQALDKLQKTLATKSNQAEPYALLGTVFLGLNKPQQASTYFRQAFRLDPKAELVNRLQGLMSGGKVPPTSPQEQQPDYDALLQRAERDLQILSKNISATHFELSLSVDELNHQEKTLKSLYQQKQILQRMSTTLSAELDVLNLQQGLQSLETALRKLECKLEGSRASQRTSLSLQHLLKKVQEAQIAYESGESLAASELELLLDACDLTADQIDSLEQSGQLAPGVVKIYHQVIAELGELQDNLAL